MFALTSATLIHLLSKYAFVVRVNYGDFDQVPQVLGAVHAIEFVQLRQTLRHDEADGLGDIDVIGQSNAAISTP